MPFKLYVDSRFREDVPGATDCAFKIQLPHPIVVSGKAFVDVCLVPNTFYNVRVNETDRFYIQEDGPNPGDPQTFRILQLTPGQYNAETLRSQLETALNYQSTIPNYTVQYQLSTNKLQVANTSGTAFYIWPDQALKRDPDNWNTPSQIFGGPTVNPNNLMSAMSICGFASGDNYLQGPGNITNAPDSVNTLPYSQLFLRSTLGEGYDAIGPDGSSDIIRRITCNVPFNDIIQDLHGLPFDTVTVGKNREINSLKFRLTDIRGNTVNTFGHPMGFSIIFIDDDRWPLDWFSLFQILSRLSDKNFIIGGKPLGSSISIRRMPSQRIWKSSSAIIQ